MYLLTNEHNLNIKIWKFNIFQILPKNYTENKHCDVANELIVCIAEVIGHMLGWIAHTHTYSNVRWCGAMCTLSTLRMHLLASSLQNFIRAKFIVPFILMMFCFLECVLFGIVLTWIHSQLINFFTRFYFSDKHFHVLSQQCLSIICFILSFCV